MHFHGDLKVYASDACNDAIKQARRGIYQVNAMTELPKQWVDLAFEGGGVSRYKVRKELREGVKIVQAASGHSHMLATSRDGNVWSWGYGKTGALGSSNSRHSLACSGSNSWLACRVARW